MPKHDYSFLDQALHKLALNYNSIAELSYTLDQKLVPTAPSKLLADRHVFVSGLARAGTSVLMRKFYATGNYHSLTYRDMPFVLAPNLWKKFTSLSNRQLADSERAHGDNLQVNLDTPECFDEVFWRVFSGDDYIQANSMTPYQPEQQVVEQFAQYIHAVLYSGGAEEKRYLSKNNNNLLRLPAITASLPNALIVVPFREPIQHANSLLKQHLNFCALQEKDKFTLSYMSWLGHHEFGLGHIPFQFDTANNQHKQLNNINYWLKLWCSTYSWIENHTTESMVYVCYEDLCSDGEVWLKLAAIAQCETNGSTGHDFKLSHKNISDELDTDLLHHATQLYSRLTSSSRKRLSV